MIINQKFYTSLYSFLINNNFESLLSSEEDTILTIDETKNFKKILLESYLKIYCDKSFSDEKYFLGMANTKLVELVFQILFKFLVKKKNENYFSNTNQNFFQAKFNFHKISYFKKAYHLSKIFFDKKMNELIHNKPNFAYNIGQKSNITNAYCKETGLQELKFNRFLFSNNKSYLDLKIKTHILESTNKFIDLINKKILIIEDNYKEILKEQINKKLFLSLNFIRSVTINLKKKNITVISVANGSPVNRAFLAGSRLAGVKTVGFLHGNPYATLLGSGARVFSDSFSIVDEVFLNSKGEYSAAKKINDDFKHIIKTPNLKYPNKSLYLNMNDKLRTLRIEKNIKNIMIIGGSQYGLFNRSSNIIGDYPSSYYAILELKILKILKNSTYKVIYQAHPSFPEKLKITFLNYVSEINVGNFEKNLQNIDCIIFPNIGTTTFGYALMTNKAIVAFNKNSNHEDLNLKDYPYRFNLLKERCKIIDYSDDINDRPDFGHANLIDAIEESSKLKNYQIVDEFALS